MERRPVTGDHSDPLAVSRKQEVPGDGPALEAESRIGLVMIAVVKLMVVIVPIMLAAPAVPVFIPPAMGMFPAPGACFGQFVAVFRRLRAVPPVMFGGFVKFVIDVYDALLAVVIRARQGSAREKKRRT